MITKIKRDLNILKKSKNINYKIAIHYLIQYNYYYKLNELEKQIIKLYQELNPTIRLQTRMIDLIPSWWKFKQKRKFWNQYNFYSQKEKLLIKQIENLEQKVKQERL